MLAGAFAFTTGVGLNAAAQTSWKAHAARWGVGAGVPGVTYAAALSAVAVYSAVYLEGARDDERRDDERRVDDDDVNDETMRTRRDEEEDAAAEASSRRNNHLDRDGPSSSDGDVASRRPRLIAPLAAPFRKVGAKVGATKLIVDKATDELLGVHLLGYGQAEVANLFGLAMRSGLKATDLQRMQSAYPTHGSDLSSMLS